MSFSVVWGVLLSSRVFRGLDNPAWLKDLHKYLSTLTVVLASVHTTALMLDPYVKFDAADLFIPGVATYEGATDLINIALAVGVVAMWMMSIVYLTSLVMDKIPRGLWKAIHYLSYVVFFAVGIHAAFAGSDVGSWWYGAVAESRELHGPMGVFGVSREHRQGTAPRQAPLPHDPMTSPQVANFPAIPSRGVHRPPNRIVPRR
jgi:predicted ferric reductase